MALIFINGGDNGSDEKSLSDTSYWQVSFFQNNLFPGELYKKPLKFICLLNIKENHLLFNIICKHDTV